jgi:hypothetical protein
MKLKDAEFYDALIWAIKRYAPNLHLPSQFNEIRRDIILFNNIDLMATWASTKEGSRYWDGLHRIFGTIYKEKRYFSKMVKEYKMNVSPQLELDL